MKTLDLNLIFNPDKEITTDYDYSTPWTEDDSKALIENATGDWENFTKSGVHYLRLIIDNKTVVKCDFTDTKFITLFIDYSTDFNINRYAGDPTFLPKLNSTICTLKEMGDMTHSSIIAIIAIVKDTIQYLHKISDDYTMCYCNTHRDNEREILGNYMIDKCIHELRKDEAETAWLTIANITSLGAEPSLAHFHKFIEYFGMHKNTNEVFFTTCGEMHVNASLYNYRILQWKFSKSQSVRTTYVQYTDPVTLSEFANGYEYYMQNYAPATMTNKTLVDYWKSL